MKFRGFIIGKMFFGIVLSIAGTIATAHTALAIECYQSCQTCPVRCYDSGGTSAIGNGGGSGAGGGGGVAGIPDPSSSPNPDYNTPPGSSGDDFPVRIQVQRAPANFIGPAPPKGIFKRLMEFAGLGSFTEACWGTFEMKSQCKVERIMAGVMFATNFVVPSRGATASAMERFGLDRLATKVEHVMQNGTLPTCRGAACQTSIGAITSGFDHQILRLEGQVAGETSYHAVVWVRNGGTEGILSYGEVFTNLDDFAAREGWSNINVWWRGELRDYVADNARYGVEIPSPASVRGMR